MSRASWLAPRESAKQAYEGREGRLHGLLSATQAIQLCGRRFLVVLPILLLILGTAQQANAADRAKLGLINSESFGSGAGELGAPNSGAVNATGVGGAPAGAYYVAELFNSRVSMFTADGEFLRAFGYDVVPDAGFGPEVCTASTGCQEAQRTFEAGGLEF